MLVREKMDCNLRLEAKPIELGYDITKTFVPKIE